MNMNMIAAAKEMLTGKRADAVKAAQARKTEVEAALADLCMKRTALEAEALQLEGKRAATARNVDAFRANTSELASVRAELERVCLIVPDAEREVSDADDALKQSRVREADVRGEQFYAKLKAAAQTYLDAEAALARAADELANAHGEAEKHSEVVEGFATEIGARFVARVPAAETLRSPWGGPGETRQRVALTDAIADMRAGGRDGFWAQMIRDLAEGCVGISKRAREDASS
jgi:chromosome segregation ATPase